MGKALWLLLLLLMSGIPSFLPDWVIATLFSSFTTTVVMQWIINNRIEGQNEDIKRKDKVIEDLKKEIKDIVQIEAELQKLKEGNEQNKQTHEKFKQIAERELRTARTKMAMLDKQVIELTELIEQREAGNRPPQ